MELGPQVGALKVDVGGFVSHLVTVGTGAEGLVWLGLEILKRWETEGGRERSETGKGCRGEKMGGGTLAMERWWCQRNHIEELGKATERWGKQRQKEAVGKPGDLIYTTLALEV